ncbi:MAG: hypothetical protein WCG31_08035 [Deltaproteobacteria bacterium]
MIRAIIAKLAKPPILQSGVMVFAVRIFGAGGVMATEVAEKVSPMKAAVKKLENG